MRSKILIHTNIPAPYRVALFNRLKDLGITVLYRSELEENRLWHIKDIQHSHIYYRNLFVLSYLLKNKVESIVVLDLIFIQLLFGLCKIKLKKHIIFTDSWLHNQGLFFSTKIIRKIIIKRSDAYVC